MEVLQSGLKTTVAFAIFKGDNMSGLLNCEDALFGDEQLIGLVEYYDAILGRKDLVTSEGEFRTIKLSLTLDFIRAVGIPEDLKADLISEIIDAWRLCVPEKSLGQRKEEMDKVHSSIGSIRSTIEWARSHPSQMARLQTDIAVMFALPLMPSDLQSEDVPRVHYILSQVMDYFAVLIEGEPGYNPEANGY